MKPTCLGDLSNDEIDRMGVNENVIGYTGLWRDMEGIPVTPNDVERWVAQLPERARAGLAEGPIDEGAGCNCCDVFDEYFNNRLGYSVAVVEYLADFHHDAKKTDSSGLGSYLSCLYIYLCAGWDGQHE